VKPVDVLLKTYQLARRAGLLRKPWFARLFVRSYFVYKRLLEDPFHALVRARPDLFRGGHVLDVGANLGYTAKVFAGAIDAGRRVYAFEPDPDNFALLEATVRASEGRIVPVQAAVGAKEGTVELLRSEESSADHRVRTGDLLDRDGETVSVPIVTIDGFAGKEGVTGEIAFVKVDVQGYELAVCEGMRRTLAASPKAAVAIEFDPIRMREMGFAPERLLGFFDGAGFATHLLDRDGVGDRVSRDALDAIVAKRGYVDVVCLPGGTP